MVNIDKIVQDDLFQQKGQEEEEEKGGVKARVSRRLDEILTARRQSEKVGTMINSNQANQGSEEREEIKKLSDESVALLAKDSEVYVSQELLGALEITEESKQSLIPQS